MCAHTADNVCCQFLSTLPARRVGHRFFRRGYRGVMCGAGVARSCCRGGSGGARDSQLCFRYVITGIFSKIHLDITIITTTTTTEEHYIVRIHVMCVDSMQYIQHKPTTVVTTV